MSIITGEFEVPDFFARVRLPRLQYLDITRTLRISSWDHLTSQTARLTALSLQSSSSPALTTFQLITILASNTNLRELALADEGLPDEVGGFAFRVPLRQLKSLFLSGESRRVFGLLHTLELPAALDSMTLISHNSTVEDTLQTLGPYVRDHFQRDVRFQDRLEVHTYFGGYIMVSGNRTSDRCDKALWLEQGPPSAEFTVFLAEPFPDPVMEKLYLDLMALVPQEYVVRYRTEHHARAPEEPLFTTPNIETLWLCGWTLSKGLLQPVPDGPHANTKLLPSL